MMPTLLIVFAPTKAASLAAIGEAAMKPVATVGRCQHPADDLRAKVFRDRIVRDIWRVEKMDRDGGFECVEIFAGPYARECAIDYARHRFGEFDEIELPPYGR
jgi:hypothetical protein